MRPVNLIPPDERRGDRSMMRTGAFSYVIVGALAVALLAVIALTLTGKQISDRQHKVAELQQEEQQAQARAQSLQAFADFRATQQKRADTVNSLASSRFDWQRVLNELSRVLPSDVWLVQLAGTANPSVALEDAPDISLRDSISGPALEMVGCAVSQDAVAGLVSALEEIDGVTRVGVDEAAKQDQTTGASGGVTATSGSGGGDATECRTRDFITQFKIVAAFDSVPTPAGATTSPSVPSSLAPTGGAQLTSQTSTSSTGG